MSGSMLRLRSGSRRSGMHPVSSGSAVPTHSTSSSRYSCFPDCVLLDTVTHMGRCPDSATTAVAVTSGRCPIEVSFVLADPPALTRCVVDCPHLTCGHFFDEPPLITGADGAFLLISAIFPKHPDRSQFTDLFVYKSGPGKPSLKLLPHPYPVGYLSNHIGVLSCGDYCLVVVPQRQFDADGLMHYLLHIFSSNTGLWSTKVAKLAPGMKPYCGPFEPTKAFSVGGGSMAWVDLQYGILLFDSVSGDHPVWHWIELPPLMSINIENSFDLLLSGLDMVRDVIYVNGWFRFIEIGFPQLDSSRPSFNFLWKAAKRRVSTDDQRWYQHEDAAGLLPANSCVPYLFPEIYKNKELALENVISLFPTLDPNYGGVVYVMAKMETTAPNGWVLAVDTKFKKLEMLAPFSAERLYLRRSYMPCAFSQHLSGASGACNINGWKLNIFNEDWIPLVPYVVSILLAQQKFRQFEKYFTKERPPQDEVWSLLHNGVAAASAMNVHIHQVTQYATSIGVGKAASDAAKSFQRASEDIETFLLRYCWNDPAAHGKAVGDKINVAVGALDELLHTLPSVVLDTGRSMIPVYLSISEESVAEKLGSQCSLNCSVLEVC